MMPIEFLPPSLSSEEEEKQKTAVKRMHTLLKQVRKGKKFCTLTVRDRHQFIKAGYPRELSNNLIFLTERTYSPRGDRKKFKDQLVTGFTLNAFNPNLYQNSRIKRSLIRSHQGRCAYCETLIQPTSLGGVGHFRPQSGRLVDGLLTRPGYFFLAYEPRNLVYTCQICNDVYKRNHFPLLGESGKDEESIEKESPLLINPYLENPRDYLRFNPLNGMAYSFGRIEKFFKDRIETPMDDLEKRLWGNPRLIPDQMDIKGNPLSETQTDADFKKWLENSQPDLSDRGAQTIEILGLNRPSLVRARLSYLRDLRGLYQTQTLSTGTDAEETKRLMEEISSPTGSNLLGSNQYRSLSIDAIQTWKAMGATQRNSERTFTADTGWWFREEGKPDKTEFPWLALYNASVLDFSIEEYEWKSLVHEDTLMYLVLESEFRLNGKRRVVSLSSNDTFYGYPNGIKGVFLKINWEKEWNHLIKVRSKYQEWETTFAELVNSNPQTLWNVFSNNEIWAIGNYEPLI